MVPFGVTTPRLNNFVGESDPMPVPFIDLRRFEPDFLERWAEISANVAKNTMFVGGPEGAKLEETLKARTGAKGVVGCANGTDALQLALRAMGVEEGDTVLLPDATFWATFEAVVNVGAKPVTVDIDMTDLQMDFDLFVQAVEKYKPKAAMLVHLYGWASAKTAQFRSFCREHGIALIEDGAQAFDVSLDGESIYKDAQVSTISFYPAKVLGSCGDAGAVFCESEELAEKVRILGNHGRTAHYGHGYIGWNSRMGGYDAAWLNLCLEYIDARIESRRQTVVQYYKQFEEWNLCSVKPPVNVKENAYLSALLFDPEKRPVIQEVLKEKGIGFGMVYPGSMSTQPAAEKYLVGKVGGEKADLLSKSVINPALFAYMKDEEIAEVLAGVKAACEKAGII